MESKDIIAIYTQAYKTGFEQAEGDYLDRKKKASKYAANICPEATEAIRAFAGSIRGNTGANTPQEKLGHRLTASIRGLGLKEKHGYSEPRRKKEENNDKLLNVTTDAELITYTIDKMTQDKMNEEELPKEVSVNEQWINGFKASDLYRSWVEINDFVPNDQCLDHFTGFNWNTYANIRKRLKSEGFEFEKVENGWKVTKKKLPTIEEVETMVSSQLQSLTSVIVEEIMKRIKGE
jgi:hypothetical protein